jgi:hypothetical protein
MGFNTGEDEADTLSSNAAGLRWTGRAGKFEHAGHVDRLHDGNRRVRAGKLRF